MTEPARPTPEQMQRAQEIWREVERQENSDDEIAVIAAALAVQAPAQPTPEIQQEDAEYRAAFERMKAAWGNRYITAGEEGAFEWGWEAGAKAQAQRDAEAVATAERCEQTWRDIVRDELKGRMAAEQRVRALEAVAGAAQDYVRFLAAHHEAPRVSAGLTPTYAINLSRLTAAIAALAR